MEPKERFNNLSVALRAALRGWQAGIWTALPGIVLSFDPDKESCVIRPAVQARVQNTLGNYSWVTISQLQDVPVVFPNGGGFSMTFPVQPGDEALVVCASKCIDSWWQSGAANQSVVPPELRMHSLSDGFAIIGPRSQPRVLAGGVSTVSAQLRSDDGSCYVELASGHVVNVVAPGGINITGDVVVTGTVTASGEVQGNGIKLSTHKHPAIGNPGGAPITDKPE